MEFFSHPATGPRWQGLKRYVELNCKTRDEQQALIDHFCAVYPVWFFEWLVEFKGSPLVFEKFQITYLLDESRLRITNKTRQAGGSLVLSVDKLWKLLTRDGYDCSIVSVSRNEAQGKITYMRNLWLTLPASWRGKKLTVDNTEQLAFGYGPARSSVFSLAATASVRGGSKDVTLDEFAHVPNADKLYTGIAPSIVRNTGLGVDIVSTPMGRTGKFYQIYVNEGGKFNSFSRHEYGWWRVSTFCKDIEAATATWEGEYQQNPSFLTQLMYDFATPELLELLETLSSEEYQQEFCGIFVDESSAFYPYALINPCVRYSEPQFEGDKSYIEQWTARPKGNTSEVFIGMDIAQGKKGGDVTAITVSEKTRDGDYRVRHTEELTQEKGFPTFDSQINRLGQLIDDFVPHEVRIDRTGMGMPIAEEATQKYGAKTRIVPVHFTNDEKHKMATNFKNLLERQTVTIPFENRALFSQIHNIKRTVLPSGQMHYEGKPHDDKYWSLVLSVRQEPTLGFQIFKIFD